MMYRRYNTTSSRRQQASPRNKTERRHKSYNDTWSIRQYPRYRLWLTLGSCVVIIGLTCVLVAYLRPGEQPELDTLSQKFVTVVQQEHSVTCNRLRRDQIPALNVDVLAYAELFNDTNRTQLAAAMKNGLQHPEAVEDPALCDELVRIETNDFYAVDTLHYSKPYLVPEAALMLQYIGERFQQVLQSLDSSYAPVRPIVTSVLRSQHDVSRLQRHNGNATDSSCHLYGTTVDISYNRFLTADGSYAQDILLKQALAITLYELRYEGILYAKYERRQACFHLTLRQGEYVGTLPSEVCNYTVPKHWDAKVLTTLAARSTTHATATTDNTVTATANPSGSRPVTSPRNGEKVKQSISNINTKRSTKEATRRTTDYTYIEY